MIPVYKIEINPGGSPDYTVTAQATSVHTHEILTSGIGTFDFTLPTKAGNSYQYEDVGLNDTGKVYLGYDSISASDLITVGKVSRISAPLNNQSGYVRVFHCKNQGSVLTRRIKGRKVWENTEADDIVNEVANDLSLGTGDIATETQQIDLTVDKITYFEVMQKVSDHWVSAGTQLQYDFYVDTDNDLVWKSRPIRTSGVETLTVGQNILGYQVTRDGTGIKNEIYAYGKRESYDPQRYGDVGSVTYPTMQGRTYPSDGDSWTHGSGWSDTEGTSSSDNTNPQVGSDDLRCTTDNGTGDFEIERTWATAIQVEGVHGFPMWESWIRRDVTLAGGTHDLRIYAPDSSNYFYCEFTDPGVNDLWKVDVHRLGPDNLYDSETNPDGEFQEQGSPEWYNMKGVCLRVQVGAGTYHVDFDGMCFSFGRYYNTASDGTSQTSYGQRDLLVIDDDLTSNTECQRRAETLLYQQKDPPVRLDVTTALNTNILIGDRLSMTIAAESISSQNFDVVAVDHFFDSNRGAITTASMVDSANVRELPAVSGQDILKERLKMHRLIARGLKTVAK